MKSAILLTLMVLSAALFAGCTRAPEEQVMVGASATGKYDDPREADLVLEDAVSPLIEENETVEIGEMI